ncbi:MAG: formyltransferase family protein [Gammaproteobacteria bacterium]
MGMPTAFSAAPLQRLLGLRAVQLAAVVLPGRPSPQPAWELPVRPARPNPVAALAESHGVSSLTLPDLRPARVAQLETLSPDLIVVACYPNLFPPALLSLPRYGCLNLHPSLLPRYRGPAPLFWQFRLGETHGGVTLHYMSDTPDGGPILAQAPMTLPDGIARIEATRRLAEHGADLLEQTLSRVGSGTLHPTPQDEARRTRYPWPEARDFEVPWYWPARRAFNFIRGTTGPGQTHTVITGTGRRLRVSDALGYTEREVLEDEYQAAGKRLRIGFSDGVLDALAAEGRR